MIELFVGEKYDSTMFTEVFEPRIEKNPEFTIPGRALEVMIPVGALVGLKGRDAVGEALLTWMRANHASIPSGHSEQTITVGGSLCLRVKFNSDDSVGDAGYCGLARCDKPGNINKIVEKAMKRKVPNLDKAKLNIWELAHEVLERLANAKGRGQPDNAPTSDVAGAA